MCATCALCEHLAPLEAELARLAVRQTYRGQPWSRNCRQWAYFDCWLDLPALRQRLALPDVVADHENRDTRSGTERGFVCREHHDAIMGRLEPAAGAPVVR